MIYKTFIVKWIAIISVLVSPSIVESAQRKFIYQLERDEIVVTTCPSGKIKNERECEGPSFENRIASYYFMQLLLSPYLIIDSDKLKPLSESDKKIYKTSGLNPSDILEKRKSNLISKLSAIKKLISTNKSQKDALQILKKAEEQLLASDPSGTHILKLNELIQKIFENKIKASQKHSIIVSETPKSRIFWQQFDASIPECGIKENQSIKQRIESCSMSLTIQGHKKKSVVWKLVARKRSDHHGKFYEVWKDSQTGLIWGDLFDKPRPQFFLVDVDEKGKVINDKFCSSADYSLARAGLSEPKFYLPSIKEFEQALQNRINEVVPNMNNWYWTASTFPNEYQDIAWGISNGDSQFRDFDFKYYYSSVRCVGKNQ